MIDRSNSANTPSIWNMAFPAGVVVYGAGYTHPRRVGGNLAAASNKTAELRKPRCEKSGIIRNRKSRN